MTETNQTLEEKRSKYIKILEDREKSLEDAERETLEIGIKIVSHKRAFLGTLMTIAAAIIAGLFVLLTTESLNKNCLHVLVTISGFGFVVFILCSAVYLTILFTQESILTDKRLKFLRESKIEFIQKIGNDIKDFDSYERYRQEKHKKEIQLNFQNEVWGSSELWFQLVSCLFVISSVLLLIVFFLLTKR